MSVSAWLYTDSRLQMQSLKEIGIIFPQVFGLIFFFEATNVEIQFVLVTLW